LHAAISTLGRVIVMPQVSKVVLPVLEPRGLVFDQRVVVFARDDFGTFALLSSTIHRDWARKYSGTLKAHTSYTPTDCFSTYPRPDRVIPTGAISEIDEQRQAITLAHNVGLTKMYNRVHDQSNNDSEIIKLRELHAKLDRTICAAYGWADLELLYGFHETDEGIRWTIGDAARNEILDRLLELNHERHREEEKRGFVGTSAASANGKRTRTRKAPSNRAAQMTLTENNGN
jgi:hypothetical protein